MRYLRYVPDTQHIKYHIINIYVIIRAPKINAQRTPGKELLPLHIAYFSEMHL